MEKNPIIEQMIAIIEHQQEEVKCLKVPKVPKVSSA
jgi:hypothetical protein